MTSPFRLVHCPCYDRAYHIGNVCVGLACGVELTFCLVDSDHNLVHRLFVGQPGLAEHEHKWYNVEGTLVEFSRMIKWLVRAVEVRDRPHSDGCGSPSGTFRELMALEFEKDGYVVRAANKGGKLEVSERQLKHNRKSKSNLTPKIVG